MPQVDPAEVETTRLVRPIHAPVPEYPRMVKRAGGRIFYEIGYRADTTGGRFSRLDGAFDGASSCVLYRYYSDRRLNPEPFWLSLEEIEAMYLVAKSIESAPHHGFLPVLGEVIEGEE